MLAVLPGLRPRSPRSQEGAERALRPTKHLAQAGRAGAGRFSGWRWTTLVLFGIAGIGILSVLVPLLTDTVGEASRLIQQGRSHDAIALLTELEAREGAGGHTRALLGQAYLAAGERKAALRAFRLATQLDYRYREERDLLAGLVDLLGHRETAGETGDLLVSIGGPAVPPLRGALESERHRLRWNAAKALERLAKPVDMVALYILDLEREDCPTRRRAAIRLGEAKDPRAVPVLRRAKGKPPTENSCMSGALDAALAKLTAR
jgi:tetratricopeptide (TPR) repeat protein